MLDTLNIFMSIFFSIIIPTYNRASLLKNTLNSLLNQSYKSFEILVIDDGGSDNTEQMIEELADPRIKYFWKENAERGAARNFGARQAKGEYLNFFDSDDIAYENHLLTAFEYITANSDTIVFHTSYDWKNPGLEKIAPSGIFSGEINHLVLNKNILSCNNVFVRKTEFLKLFFSEDRSLSGSEDWFLWLRYACQHTFKSIATVTSAIIQHDSRSMITATGASTLARTQSLKRHLVEDPVLNRNQRLYNSVLSEMYSLTALHYAIEQERRLAITFLVKSINLKLSVIYRRRFLAVIKYLLS